MKIRKGKRKQNETACLGIGRRLGESKWKRRRISSPEGLSNNHLYCLGASGVGKTRLLFALLKAALEDENRAVVLFDPHSDLYKTMISAIAEQAFGTPQRHELAERVALIDPTDLTHGSVGINLLETEADQLLYEVVAELISAFHAIWEDAWGARLEDLLRCNALALGQMGLSLAEMPRMLSDESFRGFVASQLNDESLRLYFEHHFHGLSPSDQRVFIESTRNKVSAFTSNPYLHPILSQVQSTVRFTELLNTGKVVLINLSRAKLKTESRRLFGSLLFAKLLMATLSRDSLAESERAPVSVFVDEFHEIFCPDLFLPILEGGRKYRVSLAGLFHQSLSQLEPEAVDVILGNTSTQVCFQVGRKDAERMAKEFFHFTGLRVKYEERDLLGRKDEPEFFNVQEELEHAISELMHQGVRECYVKFKTGDADDLYIAKTPDVQYPPPHPEWEQRLVELSAAKYNRPLALIEQERRARMERLDALMQAANAEASRTASKPIRPRRART